MSTLVPNFRRRARSDGRLNRERRRKTIEWKMRQSSLLLAINNPPKYASVSRETVSVHSFPDLQGAYIYMLDYSKLTGDDGPIGLPTEVTRSCPGWTTPGENRVKQPRKTAHVGRGARPHTTQLPWLGRRLETSMVSAENVDRPSKGRTASVAKLCGPAHPYAVGCINNRWRW